MKDDNQKKISAILCQRVIQGLEKRQIHGHYAETKEDALKLALELIPEGSSIGYGGSITLDQIGLKDALDNEKYHLIRRELAKNPDELRQKYLEMYGADVFITSTNALSEDGMLVNIDGSGNRVSMICFGPKKVIFFAGVNKIAKDLDSAILRARNVAAPANCTRLNKNTPCQKTGSCMNCLSPESICSEFVVTRFNMFPDRMHVILINDDLGY